MEYLAYIVLLFALGQLLNSFLNFLFPQSFTAYGDEFHELVSILIPARNEEKNIRELLHSVQSQRYKNIEILVYDDQSTDNTSSIVQSFVAKDRRIRLLNNNRLPEGWLGKPHACHALAEHAKGTFYLFLDADVRIYGDIIKESVLFSRKYQLDLLSIFPRQITKTFGEKVSVPIMNHILLSLLPLIFVRLSPFKSHVAANGQFMLFRSTTYNRLKPHEMFRKSAVEDIEISRWLKSNRHKIACKAADEQVECRMYENYHSALYGFSKNINMFFGGSSFMAFLFWIVSIFGFIPIILTGGIILPVYFSIIILSRLLISIVSKQNIWQNLAFFPFQLLFLLHVILKALQMNYIKKFIWKGRNIYP